MNIQSQKCCLCEKPEYPNQKFLRCFNCGDCHHPECLEFSDKLLSVCRKNQWLCGHCKYCKICLKATEPDKLILCDRCDQGYHSFCLTPPLLRPPEPDEEWICDDCAPKKKQTLRTARKNLDKCDVSKRFEVTCSNGIQNNSQLDKKLQMLKKPSENVVGVQKRTRTSSRKVIDKNLRSTSPETPRVRRNRRLLDLKTTDVKKCSVNIPGLCSTQGCDGVGHLSGKFDFHDTRDTCPIYHNMIAKDCKGMYEERLKLAHRRPLKVTAAVATVKDDKLDKKRQRLNEEFRQQNLKLEQQKSHRENYGSSREPLLDGLSTDFDLKLFRQAQALLAQNKEEDAELKRTVHNFAQSDSQIRYVQIGHFEIETWYPSPYPDGLERQQKIYICEFCLKYMPGPSTLQRHACKCVWRHPPGNEIYRRGKISFWEIDGKHAKLYCQNLCLLAKLFLDHKTLYFDVEPFLFYVLTLVDSSGCHIVGYFSKEKRSVMNCNLSCILTLPQYQSCGYGRLLIDFSYMLSRVEGKIGSPERPLSDLGLITYRKYWTDAILNHLTRTAKSTVSIKEISALTGIHWNDIVSTLQFLGMLKYWKSEYLVYKKKDVVANFLRHQKQRRVAGVVELDYKLLKWKPQPEITN